jgi:hypothetical protein
MGACLVSEMFCQANGTIVGMDPLYRAGDSATAYIRFAVQMNPDDRLGPRPPVLVPVQAAGPLAEDVSDKLDVGDRVLVFGRWGVRDDWTGMFANSIGLDLRSVDPLDDDEPEFSAVPWHHSGLPR